MSLTVQGLFSERELALDLVWLSGQDSPDRQISVTGFEPADLVGHLNLIHPGRIHVIGHPEMAYIERLESAQCNALMRDLLVGHPPALIFAESLQPPEFLLAHARADQLAVLGSSQPAARVIDSLRSLMARANARQATVHGVFMDVLGMGVLIAGESGLGKSELALELISRGHGLVADDVVEFTLVADNAIEGRCPPLLQNLLEVRGLGLLDIRTIFGETSVRRKMRLKLIVKLERRSDMENEAQRLPLEAITEDVLGVAVRKMVIPVAAGRNLAVLTEGAVRTTVMQLRGIDTTAAFVERQRQAIASASRSDPDQ